MKPGSSRYFRLSKRRKKIALHKYFKAVLAQFLNDENTDKTRASIAMFMAGITPGSLFQRTRFNFTCELSKGNHCQEERKINMIVKVL